MNSVAQRQFLLFLLLAYFYSHQTLNPGHDSCFPSHIHFPCRLESSFLRSSCNTLLTSVNNSILLSLSLFSLRWSTTFTKYTYTLCTSSFILNILIFHLFFLEIAFVLFFSSLLIVVTCSSEKK